MGNGNWIDRDRKKTSKQSIKGLGKPFRKTLQKDSKKSREWSKQRKQLRRLEDRESEDITNV